MLFNIKATIEIKKKKKPGGFGFNPLNYDAGNLLALYNGDVGLDEFAWLDQSVNGYDLTFFNNPVVVSPAINGHDAIQFDGINQYAGRALTPAFTQPITCYVVFNELNYGINARIVTSNVGAFILTFFQTAGIPNKCIYAGNLSGTLNPAHNIFNYGIVTFQFNGANSDFRNNNNAATVENVGLDNSTGLILAADLVGNYCNVEIAYLIIRSAADNTATQNLFINYLKNRFAL